MNLFLARIDELEFYFNLLPNNLREQASSFAQERRKSFFAGRFLLLKTLEKFYQIKTLPQICKNAHGKPFFLSDSLPNFNISHTKNFIGLALSSGCIGLDLEVLRKTKDDLWERVFSKNEIDALKNAEDKDVLFARFWTIRESLLKASGEGLKDLSCVKIYPKKKIIKYSALKKGKVVQFYRADLNLMISLFMPFSEDLENVYIFKDLQFYKINLSSPLIFSVNM